MAPRRVETPKGAPKDSEIRLGSDDPIIYDAIKYGMCHGNIARILAATGTENLVSRRAHAVSTRRREPKEDPLVHRILESRVESEVEEKINKLKKIKNKK